MADLSDSGNSFAVRRSERGDRQGSAYDFAYLIDAAAGL